MRAKAKASSSGANWACGKLCAMKARSAAVSVSTPLSVTSAGTRPLGLMARKSELCCCPDPKSSVTRSKSAPASRRAMCEARAQVPGAEYKVQRVIFEGSFAVGVENYGLPVQQVGRRCHRNGVRIADSGDPPAGIRMETWCSGEGGSAILLLRSNIIHLPERRVNFDIHI